MSVQKGEVRRMACTQGENRVKKKAEIKVAPLRAVDEDMTSKPPGAGHEA